MYFQWHKGMETGHPQIDEQHQKLVNQLDHLLKQAQKGTQLEDIEAELRFFEGYVIEHFTDEEFLHEMSQAPNYEAHLAAHKELIQQTEALVHDIRQNGISFITELKLYNGLLKAFMYQVHEFDVPLASYIQGKR